MTWGSAHQHSSESQHRLQVKVSIQMLEDQPYRRQETRCRSKLLLLKFNLQVLMKDAASAGLVNSKAEPVRSE